MPKIKYFIEYNEPARLEIKWDGGWFNLKENFKILYEGQPLGAFEKRSELENGQEFQLPDGSHLKVNIISNHFNVLHNGKSIQNLNRAKRTPIFAFIAAFFFFASGLSMYVFKAESWGIRFYDKPVFYAKPASPFYTNLVGSIAMGFAFIFIAVGFYAKRNLFIGYWVFGLLLLFGTIVFCVVLPYILDKSIGIANVLTVALLLFAFCAELYDFKRQQVQ
jgi:hypothetical protein